MRAPGQTLPRTSRPSSVQSVTRSSGTWRCSPGGPWPSSPPAFSGMSTTAWTGTSSKNFWTGTSNHKFLDRNFWQSGLTCPRYCPLLDALPSITPAWCQRYSTTSPTLSNCMNVLTIKRGNTEDRRICDDRCLEQVQLGLGCSSLQGGC